MGYDGILRRLGYTQILCEKKMFCNFRYVCKCLVLKKFVFKTLFTLDNECGHLLKHLITVGHQIYQINAMN